jgi:hypothetical protein
MRFLAPYKCEKVRDVGGFELWETGWGEPFTLCTAPNGEYDPADLRRVLEHVIGRTLPPGWNGGGGQ